MLLRKLTENKSLCPQFLQSTELLECVFMLLPGVLARSEVPYDQSSQLAIVIC